MKIDSLYVYPIKSCQGFKVDTLIIDNGLKYDRRWAIVYYSNNDMPKICTQYNHFNILAAIKPTIINENHIDFLILEHNNDSIKIIPNENKQKIKVYRNNINDIIDVYDEGEEVSRWLTNILATNKYLGYIFKLVCLPPNQYNDLSKHEKYGSLLKSVNKNGGFSDNSQILLINKSSLKPLNISNPLYFRPNIIVDSYNEFDEDYWLEIMFNNNKNDILKTFMPAYRCRVINTTQEGIDAGEMDETYTRLKTLQKKRRNKLGCIYGIKMNCLDNSKFEITTDSNFEIIKKSDKSLYEVNTKDELDIIVNGTYLNKIYFYIKPLSIVFIFFIFFIIYEI